MATTYDKASLVMIPSGYKDDKLYSIKPTDGSGDFTFSRDGAGASPATRVNASGLIEKGRENLLLQSNQFDTTWSPSASISVTGGQAGYDGTNNAWLLKRSDDAARYLGQNITLSNGVYSYSVYAKAESEDWIFLWTYSGTGSKTSYFNLTGSGSVGTTYDGTIDATIESVGNGWYRCTIVYADPVTSVRIYPAVADGSITGGVTDAGVYIQSAQLEQGLISTSYIETTTAPVSAGLLGDMPRLDYSGGATCPSLLLEPSRVNVNPQSEYFGTFWNGLGTETITSNYGESPEGVQNATRFQATSAGRGGMYASIAVNNGTTYTISFYAKSLSGTQKLRIGADNGCSTPQGAETFDIGTEWIRIDKTLTSTQGGWNIFFDNVESGTACTGTYLDIDMLVYGYQCEVGSYPTSYIPTYGSASTRGGDICIKTGITSLIGQSEGTMFIDVTINNLLSQNNDPILLSLKGSGSTNSYIEAYDNGRVQAVHYGFGSVQANISLPSYGLTDGRHKFAFVYSDNNFKLFIDGALAGSDTSGLVDAQSDVYIGYYNTAFNGSTNNHQAIVFKTALTDAECIALTTI